MAVKNPRAAVPARRYVGLMTRFTTIEDKP
jgi:hypothetical protein